jgi:hypothetical protein
MRLSLAPTTAAVFSRRLRAWQIVFGILSLHLDPPPAAAQVTGDGPRFGELAVSFSAFRVLAWLGDSSEVNWSTCRPERSAAPAARRCDWDVTAPVLPFPGAVRAHVTMGFDDIDVYRPRIRHVTLTVVYPDTVEVRRQVSMQQARWYAAAIPFTYAYGPPAGEPACRLGLHADWEGVVADIASVCDQHGAALRFTLTRPLHLARRPMVLARVPDLSRVEPTGPCRPSARQDLMCIHTRFDTLLAQPGRWVAVLLFRESGAMVPFMLRLSGVLSEADGVAFTRALWREWDIVRTSRPVHQCRTSIEITDGRRFGVMTVWCGGGPTLVRLLMQRQPIENDY